MSEGSIKKDAKTNTWYFVVDVGKRPDGRRIQKKRRGFKTRKEASKALNEILNDVNKGTYVEPSKTLFMEYLQEWLQNKQTRVRESTLETYSWLINKHIVPALGNVQLSNLTPMMIQQLYNDLTNEGKLSSENIQKIHTLINDALKKAESWGMIVKNPASLVERPKATKNEIQVWNKEESQKFLQTAMESRYYIAFMLALTTGMRQGEILGVRWKDIDMENGILYVIQTLDHSGKKLTPSTKTKNGKRSVSLPDETIFALKRHMKLIAEDKRSAENLYQDHDLVVCTSVGTPTSPRNLCRSFYNLIKKANVKRIRFHDLRHTHATLLLLQGVNPKIVSERLGHANVRMTLDTYSHLMPSMQMDTAKNFGRFLFDGKQPHQSDDIIKENVIQYPYVDPMNVPVNWD